MENKLIFGCIADDFTGASDVASFLVKGGLKTLLSNGIPDVDSMAGVDCDAVVIALKTRTQDTQEAVRYTLSAAKWLKDRGVLQLFIKYCSTFDSTKEGNIGPIVDRILEEYDEQYTILCPALPVNKRIVKNGHLYVDGIPLNESHMRNHPLTPMWESDIAKLMEPQGKYRCLKINDEMLNGSSREIQAIIEEFGKDKKHFYVIPDFIEEKDARKIVEVFGHLPILTGGSGLMEEIAKKHSASRQTRIEKIESRTEGKALLLAGSCSNATLGQIAYFQKSGGKSIKISPIELMEGNQTIEGIWEYVQTNSKEPILIYSSDEAAAVKKTQAFGAQKVAGLLEKTMTELAKRAVDKGFTRIIVAGGETSGAVTKGLEFSMYLIGESIAPGVPVMIPLNKPSIRLVLKSGNFGQEDFFEKALNMTGKQ